MDLDIATDQDALKRQRCLRALASGHSIQAAAAIAGVGPAWLAAQLRGPTSLRAKFILLLDKAGLTDRAIAETLSAAMLRSTQPKWNRAEERWDHFDDTEVRLRAAIEATKLKGLYPHDRDHQNVTAVQIVTPLFADGAASPSQTTLTQRTWTVSADASMSPDDPEPSDLAVPPPADLEPPRPSRPSRRPKPPPTSGNGRPKPAR